MNKRILKLFNEAGFHQPEMERLGIEDKFEKFAELIVEECAGIAYNNLDDTDDAVRVSGLILNNFGVR